MVKDFDNMIASTRSILGPPHRMLVRYLLLGQVNLSNLHISKYRQGSFNNSGYKEHSKHYSHRLINEIDFFLLSGL